MELLSAKSVKLFWNLNRVHQAWSENWIKFIIFNAKLKYKKNIDWPMNTRLKTSFSPNATWLNCRKELRFSTRLLVLGTPVWEPPIWGPSVWGPPVWGPPVWVPPSGHPRSRDILIWDSVAVMTKPYTTFFLKIFKIVFWLTSYYLLQDAASQMLRPCKKRKISNFF